jgi:hypothetical protein
MLLYRLRPTESGPSEAVIRDKGVYITKRMRRNFQIMSEK